MSTGQRFAGPLAALGVVLASANARAERPAPSVIADVPNMSFDVGGSIAEPSLGRTMFTTLDTFNGQHTYYHASGASLGVVRPLAMTFDATMHLAPFSFRSLAFVTTFQFGGLTSNMTPASTPFGPVDQSNTTYWSWVIGPEAQFRFSDLLVRGAVLGGGRYTSVGDFSAMEWRVAGRAQVDWIVGGERRGDTAPITLGLYAAGDVVPSLGWGVGVSMSLSIL